MVALPGALLQQVIATALSIGGDFFPQVSGMSIVFDPDDPGAAQVLVGGEPLDPARPYTATIHFGILQGLEQLLGFPIDAQAVGMTDYEAVREWLARERVVAPLHGGRIVAVTGT